MGVDVAFEWPKGPTRWFAGRTMFVSVPFTWNISELCAEFRQRDFMYDKIVIGGPAVELMPHAFDEFEHVSVGHACDGVLQRINKYATRTTAGCMNRCKFCAVPIVEGEFVELGDWPDLPVLCDNNILAASQPHFDKAMDRLERHGWCDFNQGLDSRLLTDYHAERIGRVRGAIARLALDNAATCAQWESAFALLVKHGTAKSRIRSYVLCGFNSGPQDAWARCEFVEEHGAMALPQWFHPLDATDHNAVLECHRDCGWDERERDAIMQYYYKHRGVKPQLKEAS